MLPIILSGGSGSRLWPLSRESRPKQFLPVVDELTLFQSTVLRLEGLEGLESPLVVCNEQHRFMVAEQLRLLGYVNNQDIILESIGRNTAPAVALAALQASKIDPQETLLVLPADHVISDTSKFYDAINLAERAAMLGYLVTFGTEPTMPETGYGYIQAEQELDSIKGVMGVNRFVEKPNLTTAKSYFKEGGYFWNSGIFLFRADVYLEALAKYQPAVLHACQLAMQQTSVDNDFIRVDAEALSACPCISIDYAVMEKTDKAVVVPLNAGWNDVGSWSAVWEVGEKDESGNVVRGDATLHNSSDNLVYTEKSLVSLLGVNELVIVDTKDATLVAHKDCVQDVKVIVDRLREEKRSEAVIHREVYRPWGSYDSIDSGERFQVKRISVKPAATLSLQKHHHRAEHWIVVSGTAEVTCEDKTFLLTENQSAYIPLGATHRLTNPGKVMLEIIEVQSGSYLGEDDIVRFDDEYGRTTQKNIYGN